MKNLYQTEWQGISFSSFAETSSKNLADSAFYDAFYCAVFQKYAGYEALDADWRRSKNEITDWLAASLPNGARVLSVGCGLGYMEQRLWQELGKRIELHVQDYASEALRWLRQVMPAGHIHDAGEGGVQVCQNQNERYDLIYLSAVDYALPDDELIGLLSGIGGCLREGGNVLMISASFLEESMGHGLIRSGKEAVKSLLERLGLYQRGQLWGWMRTRTEYQAVMRDAGFISVTDGFIETPHQRTYWIRGNGVSKA